jgi:hypothetical protein
MNRRTKATAGRRPTENIPLSTSINPITIAMVVMASSSPSYLPIQQSLLTVKPGSLDRGYGSLRGEESVNLSG